VPVDAYLGDATPEGVVGLAGNVAEIVATLPDRRDVPAKLASSLEITVRGGSFRTSKDADCAATYRWFLPIEEAAPHVGFRCVMDEREYRRRAR
jgi:formylglycine-generating enzyme required for sulfatase activity